MTEPLGADSADPAAGSSVTITAASTVSYAMAYNGIPVIDTVIVRTGGPARPGRVTIAVDGGTGPLSDTVDLAVELGATARISAPAVRLDPVALSARAATGPTDARVVVQVSDGEDLLAEAALPVRVLPGDHWSPDQGLLSVELLAAYVRPQDPALEAIVGAALDRLSVLVGRPVTAAPTGPADAEQADALAAAVFDALAASGVRSVVEPAGWPAAGRMLAAPGEVLAAGRGGSLERAVLVASAFERAGLAPLVWVTGEQAYPGYWREPRALVAAATTEPSTVANLVDLTMVRMLSADLSTTFTDAVDDALTGAVNAPVDTETFGGVVDVAQARRDGLRPLPVLVGDRPVEYHPSMPHPSARALDADPGGPARTQVPARVAQWKNRLLDLSLRNRLINFSPRSAVGLVVPPGLLATVEDVVNDGTQVTLLPSDRLSALQAEQGIRQAADLPPEALAETFTAGSALHVDIASANYAERMRALAYKARTVVEETGANNLYLALGTLHWSTEGPGGRPLRSPLVLLPVRLVAKHRGREYRIEIDDAATSTPNYCLLEKLRQENGLTIPGLAEPIDDGNGIDLAAALHAVRVELARAGLPYRVEETAHLAVLAFAKFRLWRDLDRHWTDLAANPLVRHLIHTPTAAFVDPVEYPGGPDLDGLAGSCPLPADSSQLDAVAAAVAGRTFVLEGPPGTGKSQTIANLLARAVADGRRVLFVAEKRAALDVVMRRLAAVGLGPLCLDLHDKASRPAAVRTRIKAALDLAVADDPQGLAVAAEQRRSAAARLAAYAHHLHAPNQAGLSYYSAATALLALGDGPRLPVPEQVVEQPGAAGTIRQALSTLADVADPAGPRPDHPWGWLDPADPAGAAPTAIRDAALAFDAAIGWPVAGPAAEPLRRAATPDDLTALATFAGSWAQNLALLDEVATTDWDKAATRLTAAVHQFAAADRPVLAVVDPQVLSSDVEALHARALAAAESGWFGRRRRMQAVVAELAGVLRTPLPREDLVATTGELVRLRAQVRDLADALTSLPGIDLPPDWNPLLPNGVDQVERQLGWYRWASSKVRSGGPAATPFSVALRNFVAAGTHVTGAERDAVQAVAGAAGLLAAWSDNATFADWSGPAGLVATWRSTAAARRLDDPRALGAQRWLALLTRLEPMRAAGAGEARRCLLRGEPHADDAVTAWDAGVAATSLAERTDAYDLDLFDPAAQARTIDRFAGASRQVRHQLVSAGPAALVGNRTFDPGSSLGRIGELQRELSKQRRGLSVRGLMSEYGDLVTAIMPCVLVSPDSLARFFPPQAGQFDLVVFDEASQIRVPDAIGAMGRARSVVVVGDSKQMPPTVFADSSGEAPEDDGPAGRPGDEVLDDLAVPDEESILSECVQAGLPQRWLSWHYRSTDEVLISFSNRRYYEGRLSSFPSHTDGRADPGPDGHGISLVRVPGRFLRSDAGKLLRTNPIEATAVVSEIRARFDAAAAAAGEGGVPSIGVVTFNAQQRSHIESLLRDLGDDRITAALDRTDGEGLFVKNLENVQGDERDTILFSTAFSANARGVLPLNFGPLNRFGGERRLNVAVTRARRQVVVFSSFDPADLRAEQTSSVGVKHLREYLDLAAGGPAAVAGGPAPVRRPDRHRDDVAGALRARGPEVRIDVGLSDFTIDLVLATGPGSPPLMAVLLDGPGWAARRTVGDRDGLPVDVLGGQLGWPAVERIWLPEWRADPDGTADRIVARLHEVATRPSGPPTAPPLPDAPEPVAAPADHDEPTDATPAFRPWRPGRAGERSVLDRLHTQPGVHQVWQVLVAAIEAEGPIHHDRLAHLVGSAFGWSRLSEKRRAAVLGCLPPGLPADPDGEPFAWPSDVDPGTWTDVRAAAADVPGSTDRELDEISLTELGNAAVAACRAAAGMHRDQVRLQVLRTFGFPRRTADRDRRVDAALAAAVSHGRLIADGDLFTG